MSDVKTKHEGLAPIDYGRGKLPNGWPQPTFMSLGDDGSLNIEWCFGTQGGEDSWRVMFCWDPDEGGMSCATFHNEVGKMEQECAGVDGGDPKRVGSLLERWLRSGGDE